MMKLNKKLLPILIVGLTLGALGIAKRVLAQPVVKMAAMPPRVEDLQAAPGEVVTRQIKVRNLGDQEMVIETKLNDFVVQDDQGTPVMLEQKSTPEDNRWALSQWVNVTPTRFVLKPGEIQKLDLVIVVPENANPGGHYAAVVYQPAEDATLGNTGSKVNPSVASLLYLTVEGDIKEDANVSRFEVPGFSEFGPINFNTEIENLSEVHIKPQAQIKVYNLLNQTATTLDLEEKNIFPGRARQFENTWNKKWLFGRFKAQLSGSYGATGQALLATAYFWVIPWRLILVVVLTLALITAAVIYLKKRNTPQGPIVKNEKDITQPEEPQPEEE
jgi:hypothetical protein